MDKKEIIELAKCCLGRESCENCEYTKSEPVCEEIFAKFILDNFVGAEKEPAPSANDTSSKDDNISQLNDTAKLKICQEALLNIGDRIAECADGDDYILGYVHAALDVIGLKAGDGDD
jgi:hypothetical protein